MPTDKTFTVTLTADQIDLIVDLLPQPLERELLEEELSVTDRNEAEYLASQLTDLRGALGTDA